MIFQIPLEEVCGISYEELEHEKLFVDCVKPMIIIPEPVFQGILPSASEDIPEIYKNVEEFLRNASEDVSESQITRKTRTGDLEIELCRRLSAADCSKYFNGTTGDFDIEGYERDINGPETCVFSLHLSSRGKCYINCFIEGDKVTGFSMDTDPREFNPSYQGWLVRPTFLKDSHMHDSYICQRPPKYVVRELADLIISG
jgi:hypothetical protein